jgi:hypothetical protein
MNIDATNLSQFFYNYVFVIGGVGTALWIFFKLGVHKAIEEHMDELREELSPINDMEKRLGRIEYALYNDGQTGLINKVDSLLENQQQIKEEVLILKVQHEHKPVRKSRAKK